MLQTFHAFDFIHDIHSVSVISRTTPSAAARQYPRSGMMRRRSQEIRTMTDEPTRPTGEQFAGKLALPDRMQKEMALCRAIDCLAPALRALRLGLEASDEHIGMTCIDADNCTPEDGLELRRRWVAASILMNGAVNAVEKEGAVMIAAVKDLLAL
jgi:hypothetical protein